MCFFRRSISSVTWRQMLGDPRLHQRFHGRDEQMNRRLFRASQAGAITTGEWKVVVLVEEDRFQGADAFFQIIHADVLLRRRGKIAPEVPVLAQKLHRLRGLLHRPQGIVVADLDALHAALAGVGVDRDRQKTAAPRLILLRQRVVRPRQRELESVELFPEELELLVELLLFGPWSSLWVSVCSIA